MPRPSPSPLKPRAPPLRRVSHRPWSGFVVAAAERVAGRVFFNALDVSSMYGLPSSSSLIHLHLTPILSIIHPHAPLYPYFPLLPLYATYLSIYYYPRRLSLRLPPLPARLSLAPCSAPLSLSRCAAPLSRPWIGRPALAAFHGRALAISYHPRLFLYRHRLPLPVIALISLTSSFRAAHRLFSSMRRALCGGADGLRERRLGASAVFITSSYLHVAGLGLDAPRPASSPAAPARSRRPRSPSRRASCRG